MTSTVSTFRKPFFGLLLLMATAAVLLLAHTSSARVNPAVAKKSASQELLVKKHARSSKRACRRARQRACRRARQRACRRARRHSRSSIRRHSARRADRRGRRCTRRRGQAKAARRGDTTPPETTITSGPTGTISSTSASFGFSSNESRSTFECRLDASPWAVCSSPKAYSNLLNATHEFEVRAKDRAGNLDSTPATRSFTVSVTPPPPPSSSTPPPSSTPGKITSWRAPGSAPLTDADAASRVTAAPEIRQGNIDENAYKPTAAELYAFLNNERDRWGQLPGQANPLMTKVTGGFTGTTDEIIQWAAHKWGIPEDWVRAMAVKETDWHMSGRGDRKTVADPTRYPAYSRITGTSDVYQSLGIVQIRWDHPDANSTGIGSEPLRWKSTAFNLDYALAEIRWYFDGLCSWCGAGYSAGQEWESLAAWYNPYPWKNAGQLGYIESVKTILANRTWAQPGY